MIRNLFVRRALLFGLASAIIALPANFYAGPPAAQQPDIKVNGFFSVEKAQQGHTLQAAVVMDIPPGFHVNSNRPLSKFAIPTVLRVEAPGGIKIAPVVYPRSIVRRFSFSDEQLAVYEGRAVLRFNITIPPNFETGVTGLRARLKFQSCNDEVCFPPATRDVQMPIAVVGANDPVKHINGQFFGRGGTGGRTRRR